MKVPLSWLAEFIALPIPAAALAQRLTMAGLEAEKIEEIGALWDHVYVGEVLSVMQHPNADRLVLADVRAAEHRLTVVTGAPNIAAGQKVPLALAGARLYDGHSETKELKTLKPGQIRGVTSEGMVCSEKELGLSEEHDGIMVLEDDAPVGASLKSYLGDTVIEFEITPNLAHAFSIHGIAREAAALLELPVKLPPIADIMTMPRGAADLVTIQDSALCSRYMAIVIRGVTVGSSPEWLVRRLAAAGLRSINTVVDVTNYVMHEFGQPLHAFDLDTLEGPKIVVRRAVAGESLETLDHVERRLTPEMLVIADAMRPVALAGVMGGFATEVADGTTSILLEGASFHMTSVRQTARSLRLRTDASARFERGIDPNVGPLAMARASDLLLQLIPGATVSAVADVYPEPVGPMPLSLPFAKIERVLGVEYPTEQVLAVLDRLGFAPSLSEPDDAQTLSVTVPTFRRDVSIAEDIVEEVARIIGYESLPSTLPFGRSTPIKRDPMFRIRRKVRDILQAAGASEAISYVTVSRDQLQPFTSKGSVGFLRAGEADQLLRVKNPLHAEFAILRPTLVPSLVGLVAENLKHESTVRLQELARVYLPTALDSLPNEVELAALVLCGARTELSLDADRRAIDFSDLKGTLDALFQRFSILPVVVPTTHPALHPGRAARWELDGETLALGGELHPSVAAEFGIDDRRVVVAEIDLGSLLRVTSGRTKAVTVPRFLPIQQDFAVVVAEKTPAGDVRNALMDAGRPLATNIALFDVYRGESISSGQKSLAFRVTFTAPDRALTDAELVKVRGKIEKSLRQRVGGTLRA